MNAIALDKMTDDEVKQWIEQAQELLVQREQQRKADALDQARKILASVNLSLKDVVHRRRKPKNAKQSEPKGAEPVTAKP